MFSEIFSNRQIRPWQTYSLILCCVAVTVSGMIFPNLQRVFGSFGGDTSNVQRLTIVFQHGFDSLSAIVHLFVNIALFISIGLITEKILGPFYFFVLNCTAIAFYILVHAVFQLTGHGAVGVLWAYAPVIFYSLSEGRLLKTRSVFDDLYKNLRTVLFIMFIVFPLLMAVVPIHFDSDIPFTEAFLLGNTFLVSSTFIGFVFLLLFKESIRLRLKHFAKKKKFGAEPTDKYALLFALVYPAIILFAFIFTRI